VGKLTLVGARKVEKDYFGSHLFRRPLEMRNELILGLSQAGTDCFVPEVIVRKNLTKYLLNDFDTNQFNSTTSSELPTLPTSTLALIAHPPNEDDVTGGRFFDQLDSLLQASMANVDSGLHHRVVVAIGLMCYNCFIF